MTKSHKNTPVISSKKHAYTALSLFSGCGGFCEGIEAAGFQLKAAVEMDRFACETYRYNFPKTPLFEGDVHDFLKTGTNHRKIYDLDEVDIVFGGPPCQGFSQIGKRDLEDERNELYQQYARIVDDIRPRVFLMENVPNLALMNKGYFKHLIIKHFAEMGYRNTIMLRVSADDYGVPQTRQRVIFVGTRDDLKIGYDLATYASSILEGLKVNRPVTVAEAIDDLPDAVVDSGEVLPYGKTKSPSWFQKDMRLDYDGVHYSKAAKKLRGIGSEPMKLHNHHTKEIQERRANLISMLEPGKKADSLPKHIWNGARPEKWRRLHPNLPSYTILAQMHRDLSEWVHPRLNRWISVREAARLQSFHDGFVFKSSEWQQLKQIGNAVPPLLAYALGTLAQTLLDTLAKENGAAKKANNPRLAVQQMLIEA